MKNAHFGACSTFEVRISSSVRWNIWSCVIVLESEEENIVSSTALMSHVSTTNGGGCKSFWNAVTKEIAKLCGYWDKQRFVRTFENQFCSDKEFLDSLLAIFAVFLSPGTVDIVLQKIEEDVTSRQPQPLTNYTRGARWRAERRRCQHQSKSKSNISGKTKGGCSQQGRCTTNFFRRWERKRHEKGGAKS